MLSRTPTKIILDDNSTASDGPVPNDNPYAQGSTNRDGFSRIEPQASQGTNVGNSSRNNADKSGTAGPRSRDGQSDPYGTSTPFNDGFKAPPAPAPPNAPSIAQHHRGSASEAEAEALLRPFFLHANLPPDALEANGSVRLARTFVIRMLGENQFQREQNGQLVLKTGSMLRNRDLGRLRLPDILIDWLEDVDGEEISAVPAAVVRQYWTRPRYNEG